MTDPCKAENVFLYGTDEHLNFSESPGIFDEHYTKVNWLNGDTGEPSMYNIIFIH